jgi:hypothetical protein
MVEATIRLSCCQLEGSRGGTAGEEMRGSEPRVMVVVSAGRSVGAPGAEGVVVCGGLLALSVVFSSGLIAGNVEEVTLLDWIPS